MVKGPAPFDQGIFLMHLGKGKEYFEKGDFQKAREELEAAYHLRPQDEKVLNLLGMTYFKMEMLPQAEEMYVALSANNPDVYTLQSNLGLIRLKLEKLDQAETALVRALELQPTNPKAHFYLGLLYEKMEIWDKALLHFEYARADKMVVRAREKLAEQRAREAQVNVGASVLPYEVLEVLQEEERDTAHDLGETAMAPSGIIPPHAGPAVAPAGGEVLRVTEQEMAAVAGSEWMEHGGSTDKMRRKDVIEAMKRLEEKEAEEEEVLVEDAEIPPVAEEEAVVSEKPWEKTQPTIVSQHDDEEAEPRITEEIKVTADNFRSTLQPPSSGLFIPEDTAADISTFLAQSREGDAGVEEEPDFIVEPPGAAAPGFAIVPDATVVRPSEGHDSTIARIPTPEEIENATMDFGKESIFTREEEHPAAPSDVTHAVPADEPEEEEPVGEEVEEAAEFEEEEAAEHGVLTESPFASEPLRAPVEPEHRVEQTIPMAQTEVSAKTPREPAIVEGFQPANLDQFSRDRFYIQPLIGADRFLLIDPHLLEIIISDRMIVRKGTISSYTGRISFTPWANEGMPLVEVSGSGILFLADRRKEIFIISLNNESIFVESNHLLVVQSVLKVEPYSLQHGDDVFSTVKVSGRGTIAITCQTKPLTLNVYEAMPANIPAEALIAWSGNLSAEVVSDAALYSVMMQPDEAGALLRFSGGGDVVVEQGSLWGDRRLKK